MSPTSSDILPSVRPDFLQLSRQGHQWEPSVQMSEPVGDNYIQATVQEKLGVIHVTRLRLQVRVEEMTRTWSKGCCQLGRLWPPFCLLRWWDFFFLLSIPPLPSFPLLVLRSLYTSRSVHLVLSALYSWSVLGCCFAALGGSALLVSGTDQLPCRALRHAPIHRASRRLWGWQWLRVWQGDSGDDRRIGHRLLPDCSVVAHLNTLPKQQRKRDVPTEVLVMLFLQDCRCSWLCFYLVWAYWELESLEVLWQAMPDPSVMAARRGYIKKDSEAQNATVRLGVGRLPWVYTWGGMGHLTWFTMFLALD